MVDGEIVGAEYAQLLTEIKAAVVAARNRSARTVNREVIKLPVDRTSWRLADHDNRGASPAR